MTWCGCAQLDVSIRFISGFTPTSYMYSGTPSGPFCGYASTNSPSSPDFGQLIAVEPTGSAANEAHHFGYTAGADRIFADGLFSNQIFIYVVEQDPRHPRLARTVE